MPRNKKIAAALLGVFMILCTSQTVEGIFHAEPAHAVAVATTQNVFAEEFLKKGMQVGIMEQLIYYLLHTLELLIEPSKFIDIYDNIEDGNGNKVNNPLKDLWVFSRDIVNIILAFLLVVGAVTLIVTAKKDLIMGYATKFVLAVILVNFSWFFPRVILDAANVLTASIYSLPAFASEKSGINCEYRDPIEVLKADDPKPADGWKPCRIWTDVKAKPDKAFWDEIGGLPNAEWQCNTNSEQDANFCMKLDEYDNSNNRPNAILLGLALNYMKIPDLPKVQGKLEQVQQGQQQPDANIQSMFRSIIEIGIIFVIMIALLLPMAALLLALLIRIPILWLTIAFMPFMFLGFVLGDRIPSVINPMNLIWKKFLGAAFLPALVGIPLAIGFTLLNAGIPLLKNPVGSFEPFADADPLLFGINSFLELIWLFMALGVLWVGTFTALKTDSISEGISSRIQGFGKSVGTGLATSPLYMPFLPSLKKGGEKLSIGGAFGGLKSGLGGLRQQQVVTGRQSLGFGGGNNGSGDGGLANTHSEIVEALKGLKTEQESRVRTSVNQSVEIINDNDFNNKTAGDFAGQQGAALRSQMVEVIGKLEQASREAGVEFNFQNANTILKELSPGDELDNSLEEIFTELHRDKDYVPNP